MKRHTMHNAAESSTQPGCNSYTVQKIIGLLSAKRAGGRVPPPNQQTAHPIDCFPIAAKVPLLKASAIEEITNREINASRGGSRRRTPVTHRNSEQRASQPASQGLIKASRFVGSPLVGEL